MSASATATLSCLFLCLLLVALPGAVIADLEPNNTLSQAEFITPGTYKGQLGLDEDEEDWYSFHFLGGDVINLQLDEAEPGADVAVRLHDETGSTLGSATLSNKHSLAWITPSELEEATYYLSVSDEGAYSFSLQIQHQDDAGQGCDAPDELSDALEIQPGQFSGLLGDDDEYDTYRFAVQGGDIVRLTRIAASPDSSLNLSLQDAEGGGLDTLHATGRSVVTRLIPSELEDQYWYVQVYGSEGYSFRLEVARQDDAGQGCDAPASLVKALPIQPGTIKGSLQDDDEEDSYRFQVEQGQSLEVSFSADFSQLENASDWLSASIYDAEGSRIEGLRSTGPAKEASFGPVEAEVGGDWSITVEGSGEYLLSLEVIGSDGARLPMVEQLSAVNWQELTPKVSPDVNMQLQGLKPQAPMRPVDGQGSLVSPAYVKLVLDSVYCASESDVDRGTDSDEPYFIITGFATDRAPVAWLVGEPDYFSDVDGGENRRLLQSQRLVFEGELAEGAKVGFTVLAMESDDWTSDTRLQLAQRIVEDTRLAISGLPGAAIAEDLSGKSIWERTGEVDLGPISFLMGWYFDNLGKLINWLVGGDDDKIAADGVCLSYEEATGWSSSHLFRDMPTFELQGGDEGHYAIRWHLERAPGLTSDFKARFTHSDEFVAGDLAGGPEAEILLACDDDASGDLGKLAVYSASGQLLSSLEVFYTPYDRVAIGDLQPGGKQEIAIASDDHGGMVNLYYPDGSQFNSFPVRFKQFDGFAVGNVLGDSANELLIAEKDTDTLTIYDAQGQELAKFGLGWDFRGARYNSPSTGQDILLAGNVLGGELEDVLMISNKGGRGSQAYIYTAKSEEAGSLQGSAGGQLHRLLSTPQEFFFSELDAAALGDLDGDKRCELLVAVDEATGGPGCFIRIYRLPDMHKLELRSWPILTKYDGFTAGDVLGLGTDQLLLATDEDNRVYISR